MAINMGPLAQASAPVAPPSPSAEAGSAAARVSGLPQDQPESLASSTIERVEDQRRKLNEAIERMITSRDRRMNLPFDPVLMAMSSGFLKPTKTGSFGESMGYAAELGAGAAEKEYARRAADEKLEIELQQRLLESAQKQAGSEMLRGFMPGAPSLPGAPVRPAPAAGAPMGAPAGAPPGAAPVVGAPPAGAPPSAAPPIQMAQAPTVGGVRRVTAADLIRARQTGDADTIKTLEAIYNKQLEEEKLGVQERGLEFTIPGTRRIIKNVPLSEQNEAKSVYQRSLASGDVQSYYRYLVSKGWIEPEFAEPQPGGGRELLPPRTPEEEDATKRRLAVRAEAEEKARGDLMTAARLAPTVARDSDLVIKFASDPSTKGGFGQLSDSGYLNAALILIRDGIRAGSGSISIPAVEDALRTANKSRTEIDAAKYALQSIVNMELNFTRIFLAGGGQITEGERAIVRNLPPSLTDSPRVAIAKSEALKARAAFDQERAKAFRAWERRNPRLGFDDFQDSTEYQALEKDYDARLNQIRQTYFPSTGGTSSGTSAGPIESSIRGTR